MDALQFSRDYKTKLFGALDSAGFESVGRAIETLRQARDAKIVIFSFAATEVARHSVAFRDRHGERRQLQSRFTFRIMALTDSLSTITAYSNESATSAYSPSSSRTSPSAATW